MSAELCSQCEEAEATEDFIGLCRSCLDNYDGFDHEQCGPECQLGDPRNTGRYTE